MKPRIDHSRVVTQEAAHVQGGADDDRQFVAQQHHEYWEGQLDDLESTIKARRRSLRIDSTRVDDGVMLHWRTGYRSLVDLLVLAGVGCVTTLAAGLAGGSAGLGGTPAVVSVVLFILGATWCLMTVPQSHLVVLRDGDSTVEWITNVVSVNETTKDRGKILFELARHLNVASEPGVSLLERLKTGVRFGA